MAWPAHRRGQLEPLKPTDAAEFAEMQTKELQNGRLAMLAIAGFVAQEAVGGETVLNGFDTFLKSWTN